MKVHGLISAAVLATGLGFAALATAPRQVNADSMSLRGGADCKCNYTDPNVHCGDSGGHTCNTKSPQCGGNGSSTCNPADNPCKGVVYCDDDQAHKCG